MSNGPPQSQYLTFFGSSHLAIVEIVTVLAKHVRDAQRAPTKKIRTNATALETHALCDA